MRRDLVVGLSTVGRVEVIQAGAFIMRTKLPYQGTGWEQEDNRNSLQCDSMIKLTFEA